MSELHYTLITGASSGLGREFAIQVAKAGRNIILIALPGGATRLLARSLVAECGVDVKVFEFDLTDSIELRYHINYIIQHYRIDFLINNAGVGGTSAMINTSLERIDQIIQLNVRSMALLTHLLIPHLLKNERSYIMNISSMAAFTPIAYKTVYPASKAFISSFSLGLREELAGTGLSVSVVYPGPIMTNSNTTRRVISQGRKGKIGLLSTTRIASIALRRTLQQQPTIIPGFMNRLNHLLMGILPMRLKLRIVSREVKKEIPYTFSV
ncbi:SDR family NAD(P)-dependent oxidoreductase [Chitinophaga nivalis]|uniref:SDR family NAD(P)-dependent oxidoreductase n=1 Tax=Chitinophaga nivalis TaxID=2991709 RepID=A0ABT3IGQ1_9BACT|nr:SDR family NAD(P)-dependent oxidoreductase [Chitinophaga nivalis]MCW3467187.1 SDR family NAD(P)-dependent oxidoreductase [Chitinophaga nivalis]MCW3483121.1 SDR family NAD(P)-dependent oxidoreductase [Chitinophaga nivalis]